MSKSIPKAKLNNAQVIPQAKHGNLDKILFSFEILDETDYFRLEGTCNNWSAELFRMMRDVSKINRNELLSLKTYRVHQHGNIKPPSQLPEGIQIKDCYQIRISKSKGGIHGVFYDNIFYVVWLDPLHNMYPDDKYGGLRKVKPTSTCCKDRDEIITQLKDENEKLKKDILEWEELSN